MHGISVVQLMEWNQLNSSNIYVGTTLKVNATVPVSVEKPTPTTPAPSDYTLSDPLEKAFFYTFPFQASLG